ncbi:MAG: PLP-dependent transferase, partial [Pirellulaceae bacterium]
RKKAINYGGCLNGLTCYLIERSLKTLAVRVERQSENALEVARYLAGQAAIEQVFYPGLETHPDHSLAASLMTGFGGMLSFNLAESVSYRDFLGALKLITPATSLGGVESTMTMPMFTSHRLMPEETRQQLGISERLVRFSVGIELVDDLIADLDQALARCLAGNEAGTAG